MRPPAAFTMLLPAAPPLAAQTCNIDLAAVEARIAELDPAYDVVLSDISCDAPSVPAHVLMCDAAEQPLDLFWRMGQPDDLAWAYAVENAPGQEVDLANPPLDKDFLAARDAGTDAACLCGLLAEHTNTSLGSTSPYPQQAGPEPVKSSA